MKKKVCIVPAGYKPIPPVKGGAIETIIENFICLNEELSKLDLTVLSVYNDKAINEAQRFKKTKFVFFRGYEKIDKMYYWGVYKVLKKFFNIILPDYLIKRQMFKHIEKHLFEYDWIVVEGGEVDSLKFFSKKVDSKKIIYHSHGKVKNEKKLEYSFNYFLAVSDFINKTWDDTVNKPSDRSITLANGINQRKFEKKLSSDQRADIRNKLELYDTDIVLVFVGRIIPEKGVKEILLALEMLSNKYKLLIVGSSNFGQKSKTKYENDVEQLINKLGNKIVFSGYVPNDKISEYYQIGDISIVPSMFDDPAPLVIIEAMAAGLPIITTGSGGIKEYCDESCSCFVPRGDKFIERLVKTIINLGENEDKRKSMKIKGLERAKIYTDVAQYIKFSKLLETLIY